MADKSFQVTVDVSFMESSMQAYIDYQKVMSDARSDVTVFMTWIVEKRVVKAWSLDSDCKTLDSFTTMPPKLWTKVNKEVVEAINKLFQD